MAHTTTISTMEKQILSINLPNLKLNSNLQAPNNFKIHLQTDQKVLPTTLATMDTKANTRCPMVLKHLLVQIETLKPQAREVLTTRTLS